MADKCGLRMIVRNQFKSATVTVLPTPLSGYPASNMQLTWRSRVMRTSGNTGQVINIVMPKTEEASGFYCPVTGGCVLRLELFSDAGMTTRVYDSGDTKYGAPTQQLIPMGEWIAGIHAIGENKSNFTTSPHALYFPLKSYIAARITLNYSTNPLPYIEVPYIVIGKVFAPEYGADYGLSLTGKTSKTKKRTRGGSLHRLGDGRKWREISFQLSYLNESERLSLEAELWDGDGESVLVDAYPLSETAMHDHHLFLADADLPEVAQGNFATHTAKLMLQEI
jgi:hypothetical protein